MWWFFSFSGWLLVGFFVGGVLGLIVMVLLVSTDICYLTDIGYASDYFVLDCCGCILGLLILFLWLVICVLGGGGVFIHLSVFSALLCCVSLNSFVFWFFYELSIISALLLLVKDSPYPERYSASWYFGGYIVVSGIPLLLSILVLGLLNGDSGYMCWVQGGGYDSLYWLLCLMFITKVPLPPFHVWLPLVHAEASSPTSIILSGYIMKLGVLGILRFCGNVINSDFFLVVLVILCSFGLLFMISSYMECDAKRWLAMLSLFHILVSIILCGYGGAGYEVVSLLYCFGHGVAAGTAFIIIWWGYNYIYSRDWGFLSCIFGGVLGVQLFVGLVFLCVAGFPSTTQFVSEILSVVSLWVLGDYIMIFLMCLFIFGGSLIVFVIFGVVLTSVGVNGGFFRLGSDGYLYSVLLVCGVGLLVVFFL